LGFWLVRGSALGPICGLSARQLNSCLPRREEKRREDIIMPFLWEQGIVKSLDEFKNGCIPMHCGALLAVIKRL